MAAVVKIDVNIAASGGGKQVIDDLNNIDGAARKASGGFDFLGQAAATALGGVVAGAVTAAAGAVAGFVGGSISAAGDFEGAVNNLAAISGTALADAGFSFDDVSAKALQLGQDTAYSASEAIAAMTELVKGGVPVSEVMQDATDNTLALAAAAGVDLANAAEIVAKQFGVWADTGVTTGQVADLLTQAANASTVGVEDLALGLANAGGTAKTAGVEFEDLVQSMALIAPNFSSASDAGTSFKKFISRLVPTTAPAIAAMTDLGLYTKEAGSVFYDAQGNFVGMEQAATLLQTATADLSEEQRLLAFNTIFGSDAIRAASAIAQAGGEGFNAMGASMASAGTAAETAAIQNQGFNFAMDSLKGSIETVQIQLGTLLLPVLTQIANAAQGLVNAFGALVSAFVDAGIASPEVWETLTMVGAALGMTEPQAALFATTIQGLAVRAMELAGILAANWQPILAVVAGLIAAVVVPALASFVVAVAPVVAAIAGAIAIGMALYNAWNTNFMGIQTLTQTALTAIQGFITSVMGQVLTFWEANGADIMAFAQQTWQTVQEIIGTIAAIIAEVVARVFTAIADFINKHGDEIQRILEFAWNSIENIITLAMGVVQGIVNTVLGVITGDWEKAGEGIQQIVDSMKTYVTDQFNNLLGLIKDLGPGFISAAGEIGSAIIDGIVNGITSGVGAIADAAKDAAQSALDAAKGMLGISSPSRAFAEQVGLPSAQGIAAGLSAGVPVVAAAGAGAAGAALAGGRSVVQNSTRNVTYNATFNGVGASGVSDAIARSLAGV